MILETSPATLESIIDELPVAPKPVGSYVPCLRVGDLLFTSGMLPLVDGKLFCTGAVGTYTVDEADAVIAARHCVLNALSAIRAEIGDLNQIARIIKLTGYVSSTATFFQQPAVINGASNLLLELFGDAGKHARAAVGVASLPLNATVELDLIVELKPGTQSIGATA